MSRDPAKHKLYSALKKITDQRLSVKNTYIILPCDWSVNEWRMLALRKYFLWREFKPRINWASVAIHSIYAVPSISVRPLEVSFLIELLCQSVQSAKRRYILVSTLLIPSLRHRIFIKRIRSVIKYIVLLRMSETLCAPRGEANQDLISLCMPYQVRCSKFRLRLAQTRCF